MPKIGLLAFTAAAIAVAGVSYAADKIMLACSDLVTLLRHRLRSQNCEWNGTIDRITGQGSLTHMIFDPTSPVQASQAEPALRSLKLGRGRCRGT